MLICAVVVFRGKYTQAHTHDHAHMCIYWFLKVVTYSIMFVETVYNISKRNHISKYCFSKVNTPSHICLYVLPKVGIHTQTMQELQT